MDFNELVDIAWEIWANGYDGKEIINELVQRYPDVDKFTIAMAVSIAIPKRR